MGLKVSYKNKSFPKDMEFSVGGVAVVKNGGSVSLSDEQERLFVAQNGSAVKDFYKGSEDWNVEGTAAVRGKEVEELTSAQEEGGS
jgi:hypothetical protein